MKKGEKMRKKGLTFPGEYSIVSKLASTGEQRCDMIPADASGSASWTNFFDWKDRKKFEKGG